MKKYIPYEKKTKKQKRAQDLAQRGSWGDINPVTRRPENPKAYNRNKTRRWDRNPDGAFLLFSV